MLLRAVTLSRIPSLADGEKSFVACAIIASDEIIARGLTEMGTIESRFLPIFQRKSKPMERDCQKNVCHFFSAVEAIRSKPGTFIKQWQPLFCLAIRASSAGFVDLLFELVPLCITSGMSAAAFGKRRVAICEDDMQLSHHVGRPLFALGDEIISAAPHMLRQASF